MEGAAIKEVQEQLQRNSERRKELEEQKKMLSKLKPVKAKATSSGPIACNGISPGSAGGVIATGNAPGALLGSLPGVGTGSTGIASAAGGSVALERTGLLMFGGRKGGEERKRACMYYVFALHSFMTSTTGRNGIATHCRAERNQKYSGNHLYLLQRMDFWYPQLAQELETRGR